MGETASTSEWSEAQAATALFATVYAGADGAMR